MPVRSLPVELWLEVLKQCISLPTFLDPQFLPEVIDPLYSVKGTNDGIYYEMERRRNTLRLVCKSWDMHLQRFEHRYIREEDIYHGRVPAEALRKAIRLHCGHCSLGWSCESCFPRGISALSSLNLTIELSLEILGESTEKSQDFSTLQMPHLKVMLGIRANNANSFNSWSVVLNSSPKLQFVRVVPSWTAGCWPLLRSSNLTTIVYCNYFPRFPFPMDTAVLPALQHLRIDPIRFPVNQPHLISLLETFGSNLRSLQLGRKGRSRTAVLERLWELCPRLDRLDTMVPLSRLPPPGHPLRVLSIFSPYRRDNGPLIFALPPQLLLSHPLRRVIVCSRWKSISNSNDPEITTWIFDCATTCKANGTILEDLKGVPLENSRLVQDNF